jgi:peptidoglycan/LPS O-acetylase OafA/YrhL
VPSPAQAIRNLAGWIIRHLSRVTSRGEFIPEVDGIRFLAIFGVIVFHSVIDLNILKGTLSPDWIQHHGFLVRFIGMGWFGVEIFFVLSGFIVALPFARHYLQGTPQPDLGRYFFRRLTRIEPPYVLALTAMFLLAAHRRSLVPDYLAGLVYSHQYIFGAPNPLAAMTWSLEVEVAFYILAPWLTRIYRIEGDYRRWLLQLLLIGSANYVAVYYFTSFIRARASILEMIPHFLAGMLLADLYVSGLLRRSAHIAWDLAGAGSMLAMAIIVDAANAKVWSHYWLTPFATMLFFAGVIGGRIANWFLRLRPVSLIGGMCYTLYLWHTQLLILSPGWMKRHMIRLPYDAGVVVCCLVVVPAVIAASVPIFLLIEKPFMNGPGSRYLEYCLRSIWGSLRRNKPVISDATA